MNIKTSSWNIFKESWAFFAKHWLIFLGLAFSGAAFELLLKKGMGYLFGIIAERTSLILNESVMRIMGGVVADLAFLLVALYLTAYILAAVRTHWLTVGNALQKTAKTIVAGWQIVLFICVGTYGAHWVRLQLELQRTEDVGSSALFLLLSAFVGITTFLMSVYGKQLLVDGSTQLVTFLRSCVHYICVSWKQVLGIVLAAFAIVLFIVALVLLLGAIVSTFPALHEFFTSLVCVSQAELAGSLIYGTVGYVASIIILIAFSKLYLLIRKAE